MSTLRFIDARETCELRQKILRPHQRVEECVYEGDDDERSFHLGAFSGERLVTIASVFFQDETRFNQFDGVQCRLRGMATVDGFRGQGFGAALLKRSLKEAKARGATLYWCNARVSAAGYYAKMGFESLPERFDLPGIGEHLLMFRRL